MKSFVASVLAATAMSAPLHILEADQTGDHNRDFGQLCDHYGFRYETHQVTTDDGYILTQWRIPGLADDFSTGKPTVFLQHGLLDSGNCWVMNYDDVAPAFVLARAGYDVWLGNSRGNTYSLGNTRYDPWRNEKKYWTFSWYEMGMYDLPASFDYITNLTGIEKHAYIGHSQGTTQMFVGLAENEDYFKDKVSIFVALAPVTKIPNTQVDLFKDMCFFYDTIDDTLSFWGIHSVLNSTWITSGLSSITCNLMPWLCLDLEKIFVTADTEYDDKDRFQVYMNHEPNGSGTKALLHYAQNIKRDRFQIWSDDFNTFLNIGEHKDTDLIPINTISHVPIAMFVGSIDTLADPEDAEWARDEIGTPVVHYQEIEGGHLTFIVGKDMSWFTEDVMDLIQEYQPLPTDTSFTQ